MCVMGVRVALHKIMGYSTCSPRGHVSAAYVKYRNCPASFAIPPSIPWLIRHLEALCGI